MLSNLVIITILNWDKYNPRSDRDNFSWFRFLNSFFTDPKIYILEPIQKLILVFLFCEASKQSKAEFFTSASQAKHQVGCDEDYFLNSLELLEQLAVIKTSLRRGKKTKQNSLPSLGRLQTDSTNITNNTDITLQTDDPGLVGTASRLIELWNEHCPKLPKVEKLTDGRKKKIMTRIQAEPSAAYWENLFKKISNTKFLLGETESGDWKASLDWVLRSEDNAAKVMEGVYDRQTSFAKRGSNKNHNPPATERDESLEGKFGGVS